MKILVWHDKHGEHYFDASTPEAKEKSALKILKMWVEWNYIGKPEDPMQHIQYSGIDLEQAQLTDEAIDALPTQQMRNTAMGHKRSLERRKRQYESELEEFEDVEKIIAGESVFEVFRERGENVSDEEWADFVNRLKTKFQELDVQGDQIIRPVSAWRLLQGYEGEYMRVSEERVETHEENE
jgi:hypothetical protein